MVSIPYLTRRSQHYPGFMRSAWWKYLNGQLPLEKGTYLGPHGGLPAPVGILLTLLSETGSPGSGT
ncbi:MAG: hypothetical protein JJE12_06505 [Anaerolineales bacterium]|nr:hypothetical protein [Anaerolineales bacterium]